MAEKAILLIVIGNRLVLDTPGFSPTPHRACDFHQDIFDFSALFCKTSGEDEEAHCFDDADGLLLDVVHIRSGVEDAVRTSLVCAVVAEDEYHRVFTVVVEICNGGDGVVLSGC